MPIEDRNLKPGDKLIARYHKQTYICEVVKVEGDKVTANMPDGKVLLVEGQYNKVHYRLEDGKEFKSPSAAGMAITGKSCNGWAFWSVAKDEAAPAAEKPAENAGGNAQPAGETAIATEVAEIQQTIEAGAAVPMETWEAAHGRKCFFRVPNQKGVPEGQTRWFCPECSKSFTVATGETPTACPQGHRAD